MNIVEEVTNGQEQAVFAKGNQPIVKSSENYSRKQNACKRVRQWEAIER